MMSRMRTALAMSAILALAVPAPAEAGNSNNTLIFASDLVPESIDAYLNRDLLGGRRPQGELQEGPRPHLRPGLLDPASSWPLVYAYAKDLDFTLHTDKLPRF